MKIGTKSFQTEGTLSVVGANSEFDRNLKSGSPLSCIQITFPEAVGKRTAFSIFSFTFFSHIGKDRNVKSHYFHILEKAEMSNHIIFTHWKRHKC